MMPTNDLKQLAESGGANVIDQAEYLSLTTLLANGFSSGVVPSNQFNKILRQATFVAAMIGQFTVDNSGEDVLDDGDLATFQDNFLIALQAVIRDRGLQLSTVSGSGSASITLNASHMGSMFPFTGAGAIAATLPALSAVTSGDVLSMRSSSTGTVTLSRAGSDVIGSGSGTATSIVIGPGDTLQLSANTALGRWEPVGGSAALPTSAAFTGNTITNQIMIVRDEKASGTNGGGSTATTAMTRDLNTVAKNTITGASLASDQITLTAGTYSIRASAPAFVNHQARLYNVTDAANTIIGTTENANPAAEVDPTHARSFVIGEFTIAGTKVFELRDWTLETRATNGLGAALGSGAVEVYSEVEIRRIA